MKKRVLIISRLNSGPVTSPLGPIIVSKTVADADPEMFVEGSKLGST